MPHLQRESPIIVKFRRPYKTVHMMGLKELYYKIDRAIKNFMKHWAIPILRASFAIIFIWFGILKPLGLSPAENLILITIDWMPILKPQQWLHVIGWWEVAIGFTFLFKKTTKVAIALLYLQLIGTFLPLFILPEITFQDGIVYQPTLEGQYIIKNLMILSAALVVVGTTYNYKVDA
jgi:uncharacterized membrane protein YkgB